jgi:Cu+-exporting ATPase
MRNIRLNLTFAICYNALGIPLAAVCFLPLSVYGLSPMFAGGAMVMSSVSVVTNALRLNPIKL